MFLLNIKNITSWVVVLSLLLLTNHTNVSANQTSLELDMDAWFQAFKNKVSDDDLYRFLYAMPKGGDLHNHMSGSTISEWFYQMALEQEANGYVYFTRVKINNCQSYGSNQFGHTPYLLLFLNIQQSNYDLLDECQKNEYLRLQDLDLKQQEAWMNSLRLDKDYEGRDEFFQTHWQRMNDLHKNPYIAADNLVRNMQAFAAEGLIYIEPQVGVQGYLRVDGSIMAADQVAEIYRRRIAESDAVETGVEVRFQTSVLRFLPQAEASIKWVYEFVSNNPDLWVAVNLVGREDNDKGYPLRFLETFRSLRHEFPGVKLSIHAGEVDEPNYHVRDTLLLGADRIGHGLNLIADPETLRLMQHGPYLVEINLISNLLLEYVETYDQHPFPEYLRTGIPVALSTDDRGMWDSNLTDEFFVAVKEFNLAWHEIVLLSQNSITYSFAPDNLKNKLLQKLNTKLNNFEQLALLDQPLLLEQSNPLSYSFICKRYDVCTFSQFHSSQQIPE